MKLVEMGALADSDLMLWQASCETITHQIELKLARKEGGLMEILNAVVASLPRPSDVFRSSSITSQPRLETAYRSILASITKCLPELIENGWKKSPDFKKHVLIDTFSLLEEPDASRIFKLAKENRAITEQDVEEYFEIFDKKFERVLVYGKPQFEAATDDLTRAKYANICVEVLVAIGTSVASARKITEFLEAQNLKVSKIWMTRIPEIFDKITNLYDYPTLFDVATNLDGFPLRKVFLARQFACQTLVNTFVGMAPKTMHKVRDRVEKELEKASRFVGYAAELGHADTLVTFSPKVAQSIEDSRRRLEAETIDRLRRCGYLENLGTPPDELVRAQIESIREILPHFSKEFVHLALRHFSYDSEITLGNLLSRESLPLELLRFENIELKSGVGSGEWPPLDFTASDEIEKTTRAEKKAKDEEQRKKHEKKAPMSLFSLAPILADRPPTPPVDSATELRARAEAYRTSVLTKLRTIRAEASAASEDSTYRLPADAENLVPMATSKKYSALNSLKISEADKVAIRPTYDKYRYETPNEGNDVYDDEYDDEYDGREFNVERLK
uniref:CUE domain-containing protein n=1 Tax=Caenorhabditis japonica TaxID=281687 RepID=A0A8R1HTP2_CAEJA